MSADSDWLENQVINITLRGQAWTTIPTPYVALFTSDPTDAGTGTEVSGGGYARVAGVFDAPANGVTQNTDAITFGPATDSWGTVTHVAVYSAATGGNLLNHGPLTTPIPVSSPSSLTFAVGDLVITRA